MNKYVKDKKVRFEKIENGYNRVIISSVYSVNCSNEETVDVNDEVLLWMEKFVRDENNYNRKLRYNSVTEEFDEIKQGEINGCIEKSFEGDILDKIWLDRLFEECGEITIRRIKLVVNGNLSARGIAEIEGVHHSSVDESLKKAKEVLYKYIKNNMSK